MRFPSARAPLPHGDRGYISSLPAVLLAILAGAPAHAAPFQSALLPAGPQAGSIYELLLLMLAVCSFVFAAVVAALAIALWRAPRSSAATPPDLDATRRPEPALIKAVLAATLISAVLLVVLTVASFMTDRAVAALSVQNGLSLQVTAHQWWWEVQYDNAEPSRRFITANELHVPVGRPVSVELRSQDVIHSFWVPNLHGKMDLIPGETNRIFLRADRAGIYRGQCAEFCGLQHARMAFHVIVEPPAQFERWAQQQRQPAAAPVDPLARRGQEVFLQGTCPMCHAIQGTPAQGRLAPDLTHLASRPSLAAGTLPNTDGHLAGWILDPQHIKPGANMPPNPLSGPDLQALLAYLRGLR